jgi:hypothetical protein
MIKYQGQGGSVPRDTTIAGQRHLLAYINPFEVDLLQQYNAAPNARGPGGIPAYPGNAAAEGGYGLSADAAFGGGNAGASASPGRGGGGADSGQAAAAAAADHGGRGDSPSIGYGAGQIDPGLAAAAGIGPGSSPSRGGGSAAPSGPSRADIDRAVAMAMADSPSRPAAGTSGRNVSRAQIAQDLAKTSTGTTPQPTGIMGTLSNVFSGLKSDIAMGLKGIGKNRSQHAAALEDAGYTLAQINDYFDRTDATVAANAAHVDMVAGSGSLSEEVKDVLPDVGEDPCPEGYVLDPETKTCVIDTDYIGAYEPAPIDIPSMLPGQEGFTPYTMPAIGGAPTALQPYPTMGGLAAVPSPGAPGIIQMAPPPMQPQLPNIAGPQPIMRR